MRTTRLLENENILFECQAARILTIYNTVMSFFLFFLCISALTFLIYVVLFNIYVQNQQDVSALIAPIIFYYILSISALTILSYFVNDIKTSKIKYLLTNQRCILYSGLIGTNSNVIPYIRIADVNINQGSFEALFGIASVCVDEQVGLGRRTYLIGLSMEDADNCLHTISQHITKKMA